MSKPRIVVIGGGSQFSIGLCESLVDYGRDLLAGAEIVLLDPRPDHLGVVRDFGERLAESVGAAITFAATTDRRKAFRGADYLLTTFRPGSHAELEQDETIPPQYGLQGNETVGIGGIFMACRVIPALREIVADASDLCPDAWIINYTNPTQYVGDAIRRLGGPRTICLCDGYIDMQESVAHLLGVAPDAIQMYVAGTNHAMWVMRFTVDGEDGYPLLERRLAELSRDDLERMFAAPARMDMFDLTFDYDEIYKQFVPHAGFVHGLRLYQLHGLLPGPRYYWRYMLDQDAVIEAQRSGSYVTMAGFYRKHLEPRMFADLDQRLTRASHHLSTVRREGGGGHGDLAVRVIATMASERSETFTVNVPNRGAVSNLPADAILELTATVDRYGAHPYAVGDLPDALVGMQTALVHSQQLAVTAALSGDREDLLRAIVSHPLINSLDAAERCMDHLLDLQAAWLPQFSA